MTSTTDTAGHPDVAEISDLTEGLLSPSRTADVRRHLDACELCADVLVSLEEIQGLLGTLPGPPRMPDDVASRVDAALAAEALLHPAPAAEPDADAHVSRETSAPVDRPAGRPHGAAGPGRKQRQRSGRRRRVALGAVLTAAVLGAGSLLLLSLGHPDADSAAQGKQTASAGAFSERSLKGQVTDLLAKTKSPQRGLDSQKPKLGIESQSDTPGSTESADTLLQTSAPVPDCIRQGINRDDPVLGAEQGTYDGKHVYLVVLPDISDGTRVTAYVVDAACVGRQTASPGDVLLKQSFARP
ncbi:hypothetical protein [Streptomyces sp. NPDC046805]|uniref:hypothetical protein n=1 Tax=Streptomyces sp. NPDC046805 TaxID=3155134 RepID=UPI0034001D5F